MNTKAKEIMIAATAMARTSYIRKSGKKDGRAQYTANIDQAIVDDNLQALSDAGILDIYPGLDHIANFINALDTGDMTAKQVRTAIYSECLEPTLITAAQEE